MPAGRFTEFDNLCLGFIRSPSFSAYGYHLLRPASEGAPISLGVIVEAAEAFIRGAGHAAGDITQREAADAPAVSVLLVRAYSQSPDPALRDRALDAIDNLLQLGAYGVETTLAEFDR